MNIRIASPAYLDAVFSLRFEVFVLEQKVSPDIERDSEDACALHIIAEENGEAVGCARLLLSEDDAHIGRLAVKKSFRRHGIGAEIVRFIISCCKSRGLSRIWLNAQLHAAPFYEKLGFISVGNTFFEAGIEHVEMEMKIRIKN